MTEEYTFDSLLEFKERKDIESISNALKNGNNDIKILSAHFLGEIRDEKSLDPLIALLKDENKDVRKEAVLSLGLMKNKKSVDPLIKTLEDPEKEVREVAAFALGEIQDNKAIEPLIKTLEDPEKKVREVAFFSLEALKDDSEYNVIKVLEDYREKTGLNIDISDYTSTPDELVNFIAKIVSHWKPEIILDPACSSGSFIYGLNSHLNYGARFFGIGMNKFFFESEKSKFKDVNCDLFYHDFFSFKEKPKTKFDLIVSDMVLYNILSKKSDVLNYHFKIAPIIHSLDFLKNDSISIFVIPEYVFYSDEYRKTRDYLINNYSVEAIISLKNKISYPYLGIKTSLILIKNSNQRDKIFFAEYNDTNDESNIISNFINFKSNKNISQGFWVEINSLTKKENSWSFKFLKVLEEYKRKNKIQENLKKISDILQVSENLLEDEDLILIPKYSGSEKVRNIAFSSEIEYNYKLENYLICKVIDKKNVHAKFIEIYLNSEEGKNHRQNIFSMGNKELNRDLLDFIYLEIPTIKIQEEIVNTEQKVLELHNKIENMCLNFKNIVFNYQEIIELLKNFENADEKDTLYGKLWPLATSYYLATKGSPNIISQLHYYFNLFELFAAFNAIVLLSALPKELYLKKRRSLISTSFRAVSFGSWVNLYENISSIYREMKKNKHFFEDIPFDKEFYDKLTSKKIFKFLKPAVSKRNDTFGHGDVTEFIAKKTILELNPGLNEIFKFLNVFNKLDLIYPVSMQKNDGLYKICVKKLEGIQFEFPSNIINTANDMDSNILYLYDHVKDERLKLIPELINLHHCPDCDKYSLYFYSKLTDKNAKYTSYQKEIHNFFAPNDPIKQFLGI